RPKIRDPGWGVVGEFAGVLALALGLPLFLLAVGCFDLAGGAVLALTLWLPLLLLALLARAVAALLGAGPGPAPRAHRRPQPKSAGRSAPSAVAGRPQGVWLWLPPERVGRRGR